MNDNFIPSGSVTPTSLLCVNASSVDSANRILGACNKGQTILMVMPRRSLLAPYIRIPEGCYALVQTNGSDVDYIKHGSASAVWPAGIHSAGLLTKVSQLITKQFIVFETPVKGCKTRDNVSVEIDICLVLRIMGDASKGEDPGLVRKFVYELGPNGLDVQLRAAQEEAVRSLARSVNHTEVYKLRDGTLKNQFETGNLDEITGENGEDTNSDDTAPVYQREEGDVKKENTKVIDFDADSSDKKDGYYITEDIRNNLNNQFNRFGVQIHSVAITNVRLPSVFQEQMQSRTTHLSSIKEETMKQKSDMQMLQYKEEMDTTKLSRKMMLMEEEQRGKAKCAEIQKEVDMASTQTWVIEEEIEQETKVKLNRIQVDCDLKIEEIQAETAKISTEISAKCDAEVQLLAAEKEATNTELVAEMQEIEMVAEAKAKEIIAEAEGDAAKHLEQYRMHEIKMHQLDVLEALASNDKAVLTGNSSNSLLAEMMVANKHNNILLNLDKNTVSVSESA